MLSPGPARKVIIHLNEDTSAAHDFLYNEIFAFLQERGVAGATMIRPQAGFGSHHRVHSVDGDSEHLPIRIEFIERKEAVDALLPALCAMITDGLIEVQDTTILRTATREESR